MTPNITIGPSRFIINDIEIIVIACKGNDGTRICIGTVGKRSTAPADRAHFHYDLASFTEMVNACLYGDQDPVLRRLLTGCA